MLTAYDNTWRQQRDECSSKAAWQSGCKEFIQKLTILWQLPSLPNVGSFDQPHQLDKLPSSLANMPDRVHHPDDLAWDNDSKRLAITVDCKALADIVSGSAVLSNDFMRPNFIRIGRSLAHIMSLGIRPRSTLQDFISWHRRENNVVADHLWNMAMDAQMPMDHYRPTAFQPDANLHIYSDGGVRDDMAAIGWIIYSVTRVGSTWVWNIVAWKALPMPDGNISAFMAETMALEDAPDFTVRMK